MAADIIKSVQNEDLQVKNMSRRNYNRQYNEIKI